MKFYDIILVLFGEPYLRGGKMIVQNYSEIVSKTHKGEILIGIEPAVARRFFTTTDRKIIESEIGQSLSGQALTINLIMIFAWISMFTVDILSIFAFKWWSIAIIPGIFIAHMIYQSKASLAGQHIWGVLLYTVLCFFLAYQYSSSGTIIVIYFILFPLSFLFTRLMYYLSCSMLRSLSLKNERLFDLLYEKAIFIKE